MTEKIKLFMNLKALRRCKESKNDLTVFKRLLYDFYFEGRYSLSEYPLPKMLVQARKILFLNDDLSDEERVDVLRSEFNEHVQMVFTGKTEEGQRLFNELKNFLHQPEPVVWR